jgi:hypothetical protein
MTDKVEASIVSKSNPQSPNSGLSPTASLTKTSISSELTRISLKIGSNGKFRLEFMVDGSQRNRSPSHVSPSKTRSSFNNRSNKVSSSLSMSRPSTTTDSQATSPFDNQTSASISALKWPLKFGKRPTESVIVKETTKSLDRLSETQNSKDLDHIYQEIKAFHRRHSQKMHFMDVVLANCTRTLASSTPLPPGNLLQLLVTS